MAVSLKFKIEIKFHWSIFVHFIERITEKIEIFFAKEFLQCCDRVECLRTSDRLFNLSLIDIHFGFDDIVVTTLVINAFTQISCVNPIDKLQHQLEPFVSQICLTVTIFNAIDFNLIEHIFYCKRQKSILELLFFTHSDFLTLSNLTLSI